MAWSDLLARARNLQKSSSWQYLDPINRDVANIILALNQQLEERDRRIAALEALLQDMD